jgi:hypothetical protein
MVRRNPLWKVYSEVNRMVLSTKRDSRMEMANFFLGWGGDWLNSSRLLRRNGGINADAFRRKLLDEPIGLLLLGAVDEGGWHMVVAAKDFVDRLVLLLLIMCLLGAGAGKSIEQSSFTCGLLKIDEQGEHSSGKDCSLVQLRCVVQRKGGERSPHKISKGTHSKKRMFYL